EGAARPGALAVAQLVRVLTHDPEVGVQVPGEAHFVGVRLSGLDEAAVVEVQMAVAGGNFPGPVAEQVVAVFAPGEPEGRGRAADGVAGKPALPPVVGP